MQSQRGEAFRDFLKIASEEEYTTDELFDNDSLHSIDAELENQKKEIDTELNALGIKADPDEIVSLNEAVILAGEYHTKAHLLFGELSVVLNKVRNDAQSAGEFGVDVNSGQAAVVWNASEIIYWHYGLIPAKITRAYHGILEYESDIEDPIQNDANGSAKLALVIIAESLISLDVLKSNTQDFEQKISELETMLRKIQKILKLDFPRADEFIRPGFDTISE